MTRSVYVALVMLLTCCRLPATAIHAQEPPHPVITPETATQVQELWRFGRGPLGLTAYSPDGRTFAGLSKTGLWLFDIGDTPASAALRFATPLPESDTDTFYSLTFSPDSRQLAAGTQHGLVHLWAVDTGELLASFDSQEPGPVAAINFSADGQRLVAACSTGTVLIWALAGGAETRLRVGTGQSVGLRAVTLTPDGERVWAAGANGRLYEWHIAVARLLQTQKTGLDELLAVRFSPAAGLAALVAMTPTGADVSLWDLQKAQPHAVIATQPNRTLTDVAFTPAGDALVTAWHDGWLEIWNSADGGLRTTWQVTDGSIRRLVTGGGGVVALIKTSDDALWLHEALAAAIVAMLPGFDDYVGCLSFSPDDQIIAIGTYSGKLRLIQVQDGSYMKTLEAHSEIVNDVAFSSDGQLLAAAAADATVSVWKMPAGTVLTTLPHPVGSLESLAFSPDGRWLAVGALDGSVTLWALPQFSQEAVLVGHDWPVNALVFSPDGRVLASGAADSTVQLWEVATGRKLHTLTTHAPIRSLALSPDGAMLAAGLVMAGLPLWNIADGTRIALLETAANTGGLAFSPDGALLAVGTIESTIELWGPYADTLLHTLAGHKSHLSDIAFSPDGTLIASTSLDGTVRLWGIP